MEVPEIYDETVVIKSAVREPGDRAKIAVTSNEKDVDPVGACVGMKGSRVQAIIKELRGEKIDIIEWSDEPSVFAANALSPAKVSQVRITDIESRQMEVIVGEDQLSLAIGKKGQNVRLATRLVGWEIKIVSEELLKQEIAKQMGRMMASGEAVPITALEVVTAAQADVLAEKGVEDVEALAALSIDNLVDYLDVSMDEAEKIKVSAMSIVAAKDADEEAPAETPEDEAAPGETASIATETEDETSEGTAEMAEVETDVEVPDEATEDGSDELSPEAAAAIVEAETSDEASTEEASSDIISERVDIEETPENETEPGAESKGD
jgi:N utilization substance protein A